MILGIDLGNENIKTSEEIIYQNKMSKDSRLYDDVENIRLEFNGMRYIIGHGEFETNYVKVEREDILLNLFTAIALSTRDEINQVVVGLPIQQYKNNKEILKNIIINNRIQEFALNDVTRKIIVSDCTIFPESLATYYSLSGEIKENIGKIDLVIIDIGGRTTDIALYALVNNKRKIINYITIPAGAINIYSDFIKSINDRWGLDKLKEDAPKIIKYGLIVDGEKVDIRFTKPIFEKYVNRIMGELRLNYPIRTSKCILCGGGGKLLQGFFKRDIKNLIVIDDIYSNAKGFKKVGENLWL